MVAVLCGMSTTQQPVDEILAQVLLLRDDLAAMRLEWRGHFADIGLQLERLDASYRVILDRSGASHVEGKPIGT